MCDFFRMKRLFLLLCAIALVAPATFAQSDARYIVLATDVSGSMNVNDVVMKDANGNKRAHRDDAQFTFLQLLPFMRMNNHVGVIHFTDDVTCKLPAVNGAVKATQPQNLMAWNDTNLPDGLRDDLSSVNLKFGHTRVSKAMKWALASINQTRGKKQGQGMLIFLTDGDPDASTKERKDSIAMADSLAAAGIEVHTVLINKASHRPGRRPGRISSKERVAEETMELISRKTGGRAHRITPLNDLLAIVLNIFGEPGLIRDQFNVSRYHRSAIMIGSPISTLNIKPAVNGDGPIALGISDGDDKATGIRRKVIPLANWNITILRRPTAAAQRDKSWSGHWRPVTAKGTPYKGRVYLIPDFVFDAGDHTANWHAHEQGSVKAKLTDRPQEIMERGMKPAPWKGDQLSVVAKLTPQGGGKTHVISKGKWDSAGRVFTFDPLQLPVAGNYNVTLSCGDRVGNATVLMGLDQSSLKVQASRISVVMTKQGTDEKVLQLPAIKGRPLSGASLRGGDRVMVELIAPKDLNIGGTIELDGVGPGKWAFTNQGGKLVTDVITLPDDEVHLSGKAEFAVKTGDTTARTTFDVNLSFGAAPAKLAWESKDRRESLWVGEIHQQEFTVTVHPVFEQAQQSMIAGMPKELADIAMRAFGDDGKPVPVAARAVRVGEPRVTGDKKRTIEATYRILADAPMPPSTRCEIEPGGIVFGMQGVAKSWKVIDPVAEKAFAWKLTPDHRDGRYDEFNGLYEILYRNIPIRYEVTSSPETKVSQVDFIVKREGADDLIMSLADVTAGRADASRMLEKGFNEGAVYSVDVVAHVQPKGATAPMKLNMAGGQFRAEDQWVELRKLMVGESSGEDIKCVTYQRMKIPVHVHFTGFDPVQHKPLIERFKASCQLVVSPIETAGASSETPLRIVWTRVTPPAEGEGLGGVYKFEGYASFAPQVIGLYNLAFNCELKDKDEQIHRYQASSRLVAATPAIQFAVTDAGADESARPIFDSSRWARGKMKIEPLQWRFARELKMTLSRPAEPRSPASPMEVNVYRNGDEEPVFTHEIDMLPGEKLELKHIPVGGGDFEIRVESPIGTPDETMAFAIRSPALFNINPIQVVTMVEPSGKLTTASRQWPFKYRIAIQDDWKIRADALQFEFKMEGSDKWLPGETSQIADGQGQQWLVVEGPDYLPPLTNVETGLVHFRLSINEGKVRVDWRSKEVTVENRRLGAFEMIMPEEGNAAIAESTVDLSRAVTVRSPMSRVPGLERWKLQQLMAYVLADPPEALDLKDGDAPSAQVLETLRTMKEGNDPSLNVMSAAGEVELAQMAMFPPDDAGIFTWRDKEEREVAVVVSATYNENFLAENGLEQSRDMSEWSTIRRVTVLTPAHKGLFWVIATWVLYVVLAIAAVGLVFSTFASLLRTQVPKPEDLHIELESTVGTVEIETSQRSGRMATFQTTTLAQELEWRKEFECGRPEGRTKSGMLAWVGAMARRLFVPERSAWAVIRPKLRKADNVQVALARLTTSLGSRKGRLWFSEDEGIKLPDNGKPELLSMTLGFKQNGQNRSIPLKAYLRRQQNQNGK